MQQQQPAQTGQWSIPGPPQHELHPYPPMPQPPSVPSRFMPYPPEVYTLVYQQYMHAVYPGYGTPYAAPPPHHSGGYTPAVQGTGVPPAAAPPNYPSAPPLTQPSYNQHVNQVPEQPHHLGGYPPAVQGTGVPPAAALPSYPSATLLAQPSYNQPLEQVPEQQVPPPSYPSAPPLAQSSYNQHVNQVPEQQAPEQPHHFGGYPPAVQGMGVLPTVAQPSYPSAPPLVQPSHNQRLEQVPEQQAPEKQALVPAAEESAVKRGKRKAVDLDDDDAPPRKKQMIHALLYHPDFELVESNGEARYKCCLTQCENAPAVRQAGIKGHIRSKRHQKVRARLPSPGRNEAVTRVDSSNVGGSGSKNQEKADEASQRPCEGFTSSQPLEDATANPAWDEQVKELFSIINKAAESTSAKQLEKAVDNLEDTAESASGEQLEEVVNNPEVPADSASGEQLEEFINSLDGAGVSAPDDILEYCMNNFDETYNPAPSESLEDLLNYFLSSK